MTDADVYEVQRLYPQVFLACHVDHVRAASTKWHISSQDASVLAHLDLERGLSPRSLSGHLGVTASTVSAAIARLSRLGYLTSEAGQRDRRHREIRLTPRGAQAMAATSVLDAGRTKAMLSLLKPAERRMALRGLELLAHAARRLALKEGS